MGPLTLHRVLHFEKVVGFLYAFMMRIPGVLSMMVWASIFATVAIFFFGGYYAGKTATEWDIAEPKVYTDQEIMIATYSGYALYAVGGLLVLLFLFMRKRIQMAMGCVKEASKAMLQMPLIIFFPVGTREYMGRAWQNLLLYQELILPSRFFPPLWCPGVARIGVHGIHGLLDCLRSKHCIHGRIFNQYLRSCDRPGFSEYL